MLSLSSSTMPKHSQIRQCNSVGQRELQFFTNTFQAADVSQFRVLPLLFIHNTFQYTETFLLEVKMDNLKKIERKDLIFSGDIEDDRVNCYVKLDDYDWMNYSFKTTFKTMDQGILDIKLITLARASHFWISFRNILIIHMHGITSIVFPVTFSKDILKHI